MKELILEAMTKLNINRMPTVKELRSIKYNHLERLIQNNGGFIKVANDLGLTHVKNRTIGLTESELINKILEIKEALNIDRLPNSKEVRDYTGNESLHCQITRIGGYRYFSEKLGLELKDSHTILGQSYEYLVADKLIELGFKVEKMSTLHPFDLLINDTVKVDVKVANPTKVRDSRVHTFATNKSNASCDIYIMVALNEEKEIEKLLTIPSHHVKVVTVSIGTKSKYDKYIDRFDYINQYSEFHKSII